MFKADFLHLGLTYVSWWCPCCGPLMAASLIQTMPFLWLPIYHSSLSSWVSFGLHHTYSCWGSKVLLGSHHGQGLYIKSQITILIPGSYQHFGPTIMRAQLLPNTALSTPLCQGTSQSQSLYYLYRHGPSPSLLCLLYSSSDPLRPNHLVWCEGQASPPHLQNTSITFSKKIKSPPL